MVRKLHEISYEEKIEILRDYQNREIKAHEIPKKYNISQHTMQEIIIELGGEFREPKKDFKTCPKCNRKVELKGAKYCPFCAANLRNKKVEYIKTFYDCLPNTHRDTFIETLCEVNDVLLKRDN